MGTRIFFIFFFNFLVIVINCQNITDEFLFDYSNEKFQNYCEHLLDANNESSSMSFSNLETQSRKEKSMSAVIK